MLYNNHYCRLMSQNFKTLEEWHFRQFCLSDNDNKASILITLNNMFAYNSQIMQSFATQAYQLFINRRICTASDFQDRYEQLANYGVLMSNLVFAFNLETSKFELFTSSYSILNALKSKGVLIARTDNFDQEMSGFAEMLSLSGTNKRVLTNFKKSSDTLVAVRLDSRVVNGKVVVQATVPKQALNLRKIIIVPFTTVETAMRLLNAQLTQGIYRITCGDKIRVVTKNTQLLNQFYGEDRQRLLMQYNYSALANLFYAPNLESSLYSSGISKFNLALIDKIEAVTVRDIDLSEVKLDLSRIKEFCISSIPKLSDEQIKDFCERAKFRYVSDRYTNEGIIRASIQLAQPYRLYKAMCEAGYFDMYAFRSLKPRWDIANAKPVEIPASTQSLSMLLRTGIFQIITRTSHGSFSAMIVSNSPNHLREIYGDDYVVKFESRGNRLRGFMVNIKQRFKTDMPSLQMSSILMVADRFGVRDAFEPVMTQPMLTLREIEKIIYHQEDIVNSNKTVIKQIDLVTARNCECDKDGVDACDYYKNIYLGQISSISQIR